MLDTFFNISNSTANNIDLKNPEKIPIKKDKKKNNSLLTNLILGATATLIAAKYLKLLPDFKTISEKFSINYETVNNITNISKNSNENSEISDLSIDNEKLENDNSESNTNFTNILKVEFIGAGPVAEWLSSRAPLQAAQCFVGSDPGRGHGTAHQTTLRRRPTCHR